MIKIIDYVTSLGGRAPVYLTRLFRYSLAGGATFVFDLILLFVLVDFLGSYYLLAAGVAFAIAHTTNYTIQRKWGFKDSKSKILGGYLHFISFGILGAFLTLLLLAMAVEIIGFYYLFGRFFVSIFTGLAMFICNYTITFRMGKELSPLIRRFK